MAGPSSSDCGAGRGRVLPAHLACPFDEGVLLKVHVHEVHADDARKGHEPVGNLLGLVDRAGLDGDHDLVLNDLVDLDPGELCKLLGIKTVYVLK